MKRVFFYSSLLLLSVLLVQGCGNASNSNRDAVDSAKDMNDSVRKVTDTTAMKDSSSNISQPVDKNASDFAVAAANGGMMEVTLGKMAQDKAVNQRIKDFGAMMVQDHSRLNADLKTRAATQNVVLPAVVGDEVQKMIDKLNKKSGKDFDRSYMQMMLDDHKKDLAEFRKAADKCTNPSIKDFASQALPVLEKHLDSAQAITGKQ
jgi:putative membrane protein